MGFFEELKRRNVFRVGIAYVISAWVLLQFVDLVLGNIQAPPWVMKVFMLALAVGFPLALFFAWAFEVTPEGIKKEKDVDRSTSIAANTGQKLNRWIILLLLIAVTYITWDKLHTDSPSTLPEVIQTTASSTAQSLQALPVENSVVSNKSIAVLPFVNMSKDADNEFFSDGISEEILNVLARIPDLKVAARTSAFAYKGTNTNISKIAKELGVNHVLEGSVRKAGDQVRVTAQLIKADDGFHLWSETYDRKLTNIFAIQDEIAGAIAAALKLSLKLEKSSADNLTGTNNIQAYEHYLKGMALWHLRTNESVREAINEFETASALDPQFAKAYAGLALSWAVADAYLNTDRQTVYTKTTAAANKALSLDANNVEAMTALAYALGYQFKFAEATELYEKALELNPSFATAYQWYGATLSTMGESRKAVELLQKAWAINPRSRIIGDNLGWTLYALGRKSESKAILLETQKFAPEYPGVPEILLAHAISEGDCTKVTEYGTRLAQLLGKTKAQLPTFLDLCQREDNDRRAKAIQTIIAWPSFNFNQAENPNLLYSHDLVTTLAELGEYDAAVAIATKAQDEYGGYALFSLPAFKSKNIQKLYCDSRIQLLLKQNGIPIIQGDNTCH